MQQRPRHLGFTRDLTRGSIRGFTIVEMLAVVGVIVVLLAILVPTISSARRSALWGTSQSNLKQVGQLLMLYVQENRDAIAPTAFDYSTSLAPGKPRTASPAATLPPIGGLSVGSWTDILWTEGKLGPTLNVSATASAWDYRYDSPDAALYASGWTGTDPFRSAESLKKPAGGTGATPFGTGAPAAEIGDPGYFGGNPFFDARPPAGNHPYSGNYYTLGQMKRPEASMYCVDSNLGELLEVNDTTLNPNNPNLNLVGVEWRYVGDKCLMLFLDGHVETYDQWGNLRELEQELGVRVLGLDRSSFFSNP